MSVDDEVALSVGEVMFVESVLVDVSPEGVLAALPSVEGVDDASEVPPFPDG